MIKLTADEEKLLKYAKKRIPKLFKQRRRAQLHDTYYACLISNSGNIYEGVPFIADIGAGTICCERVAIANMCTKESEKARVKSILIFGPVGKGGNLTPCGLCRAVIHQLSDGKATILCAGGCFRKEDTNFKEVINKTLRKFKISELYPEPWDNGI